MAEEKQKIGFTYGVLCKSLNEQAREQGFELNNSDLYEDLRKAINLLKFHITCDSETTKMFQKLHKKVLKDLKQLNNTN